MFALEKFYGSIMGRKNYLKLFDEKQWLTFP